MFVVTSPRACGDNVFRGNPQLAQRGRKPARSEGDSVDYGRLKEIRGPLWTDLFYIAIAFGTASAIMWQLGY